MEAPPFAAVAVAGGGIAGAASRWSIIELTDTGSWPWGVLIANILGCLVLGAVVGRVGPRQAVGTIGLGLAVGFCGALTTFSGFALDLAIFLDDDQWARAVGYLLASAAGGIVAFLCGRGLARPEPTR